MSDSTLYFRRRGSGPQNLRQVPLAPDGRAHLVCQRGQEGPAEGTEQAGHHPAGAGTPQESPGAAAAGAGSQREGPDGRYPVGRHRSDLYGDPEDEEHDGAVQVPDDHPAVPAGAGSVQEVLPGEQFVHPEGHLLAGGRLPVAG